MEDLGRTPANGQCDSEIHVALEIWRNSMSPMGCFCNEVVVVVVGIVVGDGGGGVIVILS